MSKLTIMDFLDKYPGIYFKASDIHNALEEDITLRNIHRNLKGIVKRSEYECKIINNKTGHKVYLYGRIEKW